MCTTDHLTCGRHIGSSCATKLHKYFSALFGGGLIFHGGKIRVYIHFSYRNKIFISVSYEFSEHGLNSDNF